jgi:hypothetical protein
MSQYIDVVARLLAYEQGQAIPIRETSALASDPNPAFGIAPIRVVSEELVQAVAFGPLDCAPEIVTTWNPLDREVAFLEPLSERLHTYLTACTQQHELPRIWLPHGPALDVLDVLGHRYRTNRHATDTMRRLGWQCRALVDETGYPGQQIVAVATNLLAAHVVTGQSPSEDRQLRALLTWINPPAGSDPRILAEQQALIPAAAMLARDEDDLVENLWAQAYTNPGRATAAQAPIERVLRAAAEREWNLLIAARRAFWGLGLPPAANLDALIGESFQRIVWRIGRDVARASRPHSLNTLLEAYEYAESLSAYTDTWGDSVLRERDIRAGRVVRAQVVAIDQPQRSRHPCTLTLRSTQEVLRVRRGTELALAGGSVSGRVTAVREIDADQSTQIDVRLERGVLISRLPRLGTWGEWGDGAPFDGRMFKGSIVGAMQRAADARVYGEVLPEPEPRQLWLPVDLARAAEKLRQR